MYETALSLWFVPAFVLGWLTISFVISVIAGWYSLGRVYRRPEGKRPAVVTRFQSIQMGPVSYNTCVSIGGAPSGLFLSVLFPLGFTHRPLLIPWVDIQRLGESKWLWFKYSRYRVGRNPARTITVLYRSRGARLIEAQLRPAGTDVGRAATEAAP